jgi:uncharacterized peroxidase-related enzyme
MDERICWIAVKEDADLDEEALKALAPTRRDDGSLHNMYRAYSLYPAPVTSADELYRVLIHDPKGPLSLWVRELLATQVAVLSRCAYARDNHGANMIALLDNPAKGPAMMAALEARRYDSELFDEKARALLAYGEKLTLKPDAMEESDLEALRAAGLSDAEILHANQITASFAYWVRVLNGLGVNAVGEGIGLSPEKIAALKKNVTGG